MSSKVGQRRKDTPLWRRLLSPGWIALTIFVIIFSYYSFTLLAPWQLNKDEAIVERNEQIQQAYDEDPVMVENIIGPGDPITADEEWTRVILEGEFLADEDVLLRLRPVEDANAYQVLTPFELNSGPTVMVNRGYVLTNGSNDVPPIEPAPTGQVSTVGMAQRAEGLDGREPLHQQGYDHVYTMNPGLVGELTDTELLDGLIQLNEDQPGVLSAIPVPMLERGSHLSYGLQWLAFGVVAPLGLIYFVVNEFRERRRVREEEAEMNQGEVVAEGAGPDPESDSDSAPGTGSGSGNDTEDLSRHPDAVVVTRSRSVRDRYGDAKPDHYAKLGKRRRERQL